MSLAALLEKTFKSKQRQSVFDTLVLATSDGRVAFVTGRRRQELQSMPLDAVIVPKALEGGKTFQQLARTISVQDGVIAGVNYKVFIQPCCESVASASKDKPLLQTGGIIVAGLIESDALHGAALAISPGLVIIGVILMLMALVVWPFLKLTFLGERQRVTLWDLVQLGACSIFGLALGAIVVITADVWVRLDADVDEQLGRLAQDLGRHLRQEVDFAYGQLVELEQGFSACSGDRAMPKVVSAADIRCPGNSRLSQSPDQGSYSDYETFALIDDKGQQRVKSAPLSWVPNRIRVRGRPYFKEVNAGRSWRFCARPGRRNEQEACFLESLWSWASGQQQAVLSKPTGSKDRPVAALAFGMRSLIDPVLPPGFDTRLWTTKARFCSIRTRSETSTRICSRKRTAISGSGR